MLKSLTKLVGGSSERDVKKLTPIVEEINALEAEFQDLTVNQLKSRTEKLKNLTQGKEDLDDLLPEAFAAVREAAKRTLGQRHYDVQLLGGIALHQGKIAEMKTGEGKTLVATLSAYLNALKGEGVHLVTVNDYLARRDAQWMGAIYDLLGLTTGALQHNTAYIYDRSGQSGQAGMEHLSKVSRRDAYQADITYGTNNEFGFDYLKDNMVTELSQRVQRKLGYAIVDEVDNILIDEARTPLIISGPAEESGKEYYKFARLVPLLQAGTDYNIDEKHRAASLSSDGMARIEKALKVENLYDPDNSRLVHFVENALKAQTLFKRDREYVVKDGDVVIVDEFTGRLMPGRRYADGLHQALEAKEGLTVQRETITYATITLQNYFRMYQKLSGMTGTAATEAEEFSKIYKLDVVEIPTNLPMVREDLTDLVYRDQKSKYNAVIEEIAERHIRGQPILVGTTDISKSELLSKQLKQRNVPHEVLNAKQHEREANIIAEAGRPGSVTVATNMAGRGTDIVLGGNPDSLDITPEQWKADHDTVVKQGGLCIIGTERHEARRIDNQLRGRAGRQGDPGVSRFYVALDDDLMRRFGGDRIRAVMDWAGLDEEASIENRMVTKSIEGAQVKVESYHFDIRKHLVEYDDVVNTHRDVMYAERDKTLSDHDLKENILTMVEGELTNTLAQYLNDLPPERWDINGLTREISAILPMDGSLAQTGISPSSDAEEIENSITTYALELYQRQEEEFTSELMRRIEREVMLRIIDLHWVQHLTGMENLRQGIGLYAYGQRDPLVMYKKEGHELFQTLLNRIQYDIVRSIYHINVTPGDQNRRSPNVRTPKIPSGDGKLMSKIVGGRSQEVTGSPNGTRKIGRNEPCTCGSGKKYKRCHGT